MEWEDIFGADSDRHVRPPASPELEVLQSACETEPPVSVMAAHRRMLALKLGNDSVLIEAEVRRCDGARSGLAFILRNERPPKLVKIVSKLQYLWCAQ